MPSCERRVDREPVDQRRARARGQRGGDDRRVAPVEGLPQIALDLAAVDPGRVRHVTRVLRDRRHHDHVVRARLTGVVQPAVDLGLGPGDRLRAGLFDRNPGQGILEERTAAGDQPDDVRADRRHFKGSNGGLQLDLVPFSMAPATL